ncbi:hypothetical protein J6590_018349 [Homalodisca vitripennis]|nr:hypothetical protein J6590_018349 [Homalodisca vitripennis]
MIRLDSWNLESCSSEEIQRKPTTKKLKTKHYIVSTTVIPINRRSGSLIASSGTQLRALRCPDAIFRYGSSSLTFSGPPQMNMTPDSRSQA